MLAPHAADDDGRCWVSIGTLAAETSLGTTSVRRVIDDLLARSRPAGLFDQGVGLPRPSDHGAWQSLGQRFGLQARPGEEWAAFQARIRANLEGRGRRDVALFRTPDVLWTVIARGFDYRAG